MRGLLDDEGAQAFDKQDCQGFKALILFAAPKYSERMGVDVLLPKLGP